MRPLTATLPYSEVGSAAAGSMSRSQAALSVVGLAVAITSCSAAAVPVGSPSDPVPTSSTAELHSVAVVETWEAPAPAGAGAPTVTTIWTTDLRPAPAGAPIATVDPAPAIRVQVPAAGIDAPLDELGLGSDGAVEAPADFDRAGWYTGSVRPGQVGPAVLVGHVDSKTGPAAFSGLAEVEPGDEIVVHGEDGSVLNFRVTAIEEHAKEQLAAEVLHGPVTGPELRLVTCGGDFDRSSGHYRDNIVVFAVLA